MHRVRRLTDAPCGHTIANRACWSADGRSILFDLRDDETRFDSPAIMRVMVDTGRCETLYESPQATPCGVPTCSPRDDRFVFIHADDDPTERWQYCAWHRRGEIGRIGAAGAAETLDARDIVPPFTAGALRGGTHLHTFNPDASAIVSTYEDHVLATRCESNGEANRRAVAVHVLGMPVAVPKTDPRNHDGSSFTVLVTRLTDRPTPGSDEIAMATGEAWLGDNRIVVQATVAARDGRPCVELFLVTLPYDLAQLRVQGSEPLAGTATTRPGVPAAVTQRRLTHTADRPFSGVAPGITAGVAPGITGPRHWAVSSPDGRRIGFYMRDDRGATQFWTVTPEGNDPVRVTRDSPEPTSPFTWHPDGSRVAYVADGSVMVVDIDTGRLDRVTPRLSPADGPTHHACVYSPDGSSIAFLQPSTTTAGRFNQIHVVHGLGR